MYSHPVQAPRLLVVAGHPHVAIITAEIITDASQPCRTPYWAYDEADAIRQIPKAAPDVVILDADMGRSYDAFSRCRRIRNAFPNDEDKILYLGWNLDAGTVTQIQNLGGAAAVRKPFTKGELIEALRFLTR